MAMSHRDCDHASTPADRRACRTRRVHLDVVAAPSAPVVPNRRRNRSSEAPSIATKPRSPRGTSSVPVDPQPSADGVSYASCVQSVLHWGTGACACGWHALPSDKVKGL